MSTRRAYDTIASPSARQAARFTAWPGVVLAACAVLIVIAPVQAQERTYTSDADFDLGTLVGVNHDAVHDQLQLDESVTSHAFVWVATSGRRTMVRFDAGTGEILGEYRTAPSGRAASPSRTAVDRFGNVWVGNRSESADGMGSVVKIGVVIGGTRGSKNADGSFTPDPGGAYLAPPFVYSTAVDRDGDGLIRTSSGVGDVLAWVNVTDGAGGETAEVQDAVDECILLYQRTSATNILHVSEAPNGDIWVGGFANASTGFERLDAQTGRILSDFMPSCGGYGGVVDDQGVLWSASFSENTLLRYDTATGTSQCVAVQKSAGVAVDAQGYVWNSMWDRNMVAKIAPDGTMVPGFPKATGGRDCFGVAVTPADGHVWVANKRTHDVSRLDPDGNVVTRIPTGLAPTGVAVDRDGRVWVTNQNDHNAVRIDPAGGSDGWGAVDLIVGLGTRASPLGYGDMTAAVDVRNLTELGSWTVTFDSEREGALWASVTWDGDTPGASMLTTCVRAADAAADLGAQPWRAVTNGEDRSDGDIVGRYIEMRVTFLADADAGMSPVLRSLSVHAVPADANEAPDCSQVTASVETLWPPNGRMVDVDLLGFSDPDGDEMTCTIVRVTQDEPLERAENGTFVATASGVGQPTAQVRAARNGNGNGRVYEIHYRVEDARGGACEGSVFVCVPHDQGRGRKTASCVDDGQQFDATAGDPNAKPGLATENYPNPFNPNTTIRFTLAQSGPVQLRIYDALGRHVRTLAEGPHAAGAHGVVWDGRDANGRALASGVYVYRLRAGTQEATRRMLLLK